MPRVSEIGVPIERAVLTPIGVDLGPGGKGLQAIGGAVSGIGRQLAARDEAEREVQEQIEKRQREVIDILGKNAALSQRRQGVTDIANFKELNRGDPDTWTEGVQEIAKRMAKDLADTEMSDEARLIADAQLELWRQEQTKIVAGAALVQSAEDALDATKAAYIGALESGDPEDIEEARQNLFSILDKTVDDAERDNTIKELEKFGHEKRVIRLMDNIKPTLVDAIKLDDKQSGIAALDTITQQLVDEGQWTEVEAVQANKVLGDWIDNYVAGREKRADDAVKLTTIETYQELSDPIVGGLLTYDDIDKSNLLKPDKEKWFKYIKGSYGKIPTENTSDGHTASFNAVFDAATLQASPQEAYDALLELRFNDKTITNEQFKWGVGKIENPYPVDIFEDLQSILKSNSEDFNRLFKRDKDRNKEVNESLIAWLDRLIEKDQVPAFDLKKKMFAISSQFRVGDNRLIDIGQTVERGGVEWEVIGFDEAGEPLVEEVR